MTSCTAKRSSIVLAVALALGVPGAAQADYASEAARLKSAPAKDATLHTLQAGVAAMSEG